MRHRLTHIVAVITACIIVQACTPVNNNSGEGAQTAPPPADQTQMLDPNRGALVRFNDRLFNVPSPIQLAGVIQKVQLPYNKELLNSVNKYQNYTTTFKQALNLGIYGANLGYINVFEQLPDAAAYFGAIRALSKELGIMNTFNEETMKRIERNNGNKDSLLYIASIMYRESDQYLMDAERNEVGALILAGGWVESLYLLTHIQLAKDMKPEIKDLIGQQKSALNNLIDILRPHYGKISNEYDSFLENLSELAAIFDDINVKYTFKSVKTDEANRITIVDSQTETVIDLQHIETISRKIEHLRNSITD
ncbi:MAG: hypothetical protein II165_07730 [Bacteroidales bacterium]|nr:hypothetical protein [Bacteroidales bacterium]MDD6003694.1 hypothetical protein [Bacteroidales bacterium]